MVLYGLTDFAQEIGLTGPNARVEMSQLYRRGKLPEPFSVNPKGKSPSWTREQIEEYRRCQKCNQ